MKRSLDPHPEFHRSALGTGGGREDRTGHFQQTHDLFVKASSHQPCLPPPPSPPHLALAFINAVPLRLEGITSQETFQSQLGFGGDQREPRVGGVSPGRFICGELAGRERCKTALAGSLSDTEQPQAGAESLLGSASPSPSCFVQAAAWKLFTWAQRVPGAWLGRGSLGRESRPLARVTDTTAGHMRLGPWCHRDSARGQRPPPGAGRASAASSSQPSHPAPAGAGTSCQEWELAPRRLAPQVNCGVP